MPAEPRLSACARQVRRYDNDRYLTALFAPGVRREALFALAAFNLEIAKIPEVVSEPLLGEMRLQWWREAIDEIAQGRARKHEVVQPLAAATRQFDLPVGDLLPLIDARTFDLEDRAPADVAELESYAEATTAPLNRLALQALGISGDLARQGAASLGRATALTGLLRAIPFHARQRRVYLPTALVEMVAVEMGELFELRPHAGLARAVEELVDVARGHLQAARKTGLLLPRKAAPVLLQATLTAKHLAAIRTARFDVFAHHVQVPHPSRVLGLTWRALLGRY